jgi:hypothetical protein
VLVAFLSAAGVPGGDSAPAISCHVLFAARRCLLLVAVFRVVCTQAASAAFSM